MIKKILVADEITDLLQREKSFLERADLQIISAGTKEEQLRIHSAEKTNLIITLLDMPAMSCEQFCTAIRNDTELRNVSIIVVCENKREDIERSLKCQANSFLPAPLDPHVLLREVQRLLHISRREAYRALLSVRVQGDCKKQSFFCHSENISVTGMLLETDRVLQRGETITCSFFLPNSAHISADGEVVRVVGRTNDFDTNQYGVTFIGLSDSLREAIETFVEGRAGKRKALLKDRE